MAFMKCVASFENVDFSYGRHRVLGGFSVAIPRGITGLLGPNGAGKTTVMSLLATLARARRGRVTTLGMDVCAAEERRLVRRRIGYLPQRFGLVGSFTVRESAEYAAWVHGVDSAGCSEAAARALEAVNLTELADRKVRKLSGGMRQRLGIALELVHEPEMLILDEPTVGLDPTQRLKLRHLLREIGQQRAVLLSTHLVDDVEQTCDQIIVMNKGRVVFQGRTEELRQEVTEASAGALGSELERAYLELLERVEE